MTTTRDVPIERPGAQPPSTDGQTHLNYEYPSSMAGLLVRTSFSGHWINADQTEFRLYPTRSGQLWVLRSAGSVFNRVTFGSQTIGNGPPLKSDEADYYGFPIRA